MSRLAGRASVRVHGGASRCVNVLTARRRDRGLGGRLWHALLAGVFGLALATTPAGAYEKPEWDQIANIKEAAVHLAKLQRTQGATRAFKFIDACYRTHSLSTKYTRAFEACIAQDYLETRILALIYSRMKPEMLKRLGMPTPQMLADTMGKRIVTAFRSYDVPVTEVKAFKKLVDEHGFPVFFKALFPDTEVPDLDKADPQQEPKLDDVTPKDVSPEDAAPEDAPKNGKNE